MAVGTTQLKHKREELAQIKEAGTEAKLIIGEEEAVLITAVKVSNGALAKAYAMPTVDANGVYCYRWFRSDIWVRVDGMNLYLALWYGKLGVHLVKNTRIDKTFQVNVVANTWADCRNYITLDIVLDAIISKLKAFVSQRSKNTEKLEEELVSKFGQRTKYGVFSRVYSKRE